MTAVSDLLAYNNAMSSMAGDKELVPGLGPVTLQGGKFAEPYKSNDLREVGRDSSPSFLSYRFILSRMLKPSDEMLSSYGSCRLPDFTVVALAGS